MFGKILLISSLFLLNICSNAQTKSFLYEVSSRDLVKPSYIFGTFHLICKSDSVVNENVKSVINAAEQVYFELDMDDPKMPFQMIKFMRMDSSKSLKDLYSDSDYKYLSTFFNDTLHLQPFIYENTKPLLLYSLVISKLVDCEMQIPENEIMLIAKKQGKNIGGLEFVEDQMKVFNNISYAEQAEYLLENIRDKDKGKEEYQMLRNSYLSGDINLLMLDFEREKDLTFKFKSELLDKRNIKWITEIDQIIKKKSTLFAVGAGHLGGENGILNLLQNKGYSVKRL
jgi:uncharacterized protein YbaP (TraB family)